MVVSRNVAFNERWREVDLPMEDDNIQHVTLQVKRS